MRWRSMAVVVGLFTALAVAMVWVLSLQLQAQLRQQLLDRAELRSLQLADAMTGQTQAFVRLIDAALLDLRERWPGDPGAFAREVQKELQALPPGLAAYVSVVDAQGVVVFNSLGLPGGTSVADRPHFQQLRAGGDRLVVGEPVQGRLDGRWLIVVGRPILREGRFDGAVHLLVSADFLAQVLARLTLSEQDLVALVHPSGRIMARSLDHGAAVGQLLPADRPFLQDPAALKGTFFQTGATDGVARVFGWLRPRPGEMVVVVGLSEASVLKPVDDTRRRAMWLTGVLSLVLVAIGAWIGRLQWRLEQGQEAMRQSRERLREAQRIAHVGHWRFDAASGQLHWSEEIYRIFGLSAEPAAPGLDAYWPRVHPEDVPRLKQRFHDALTDDRALDEVHRIVRPDGTERHVRLIGQHDAGAAGRVFHGTLQDVTELREAQLALQRLNTGLEKRVKARTAELQALNRELESFTYSVSHDLRTPLRSIHGFATLLQETEAGRLSAEGLDFLRRIQDSSRRMGTLITDLLSMAQHSRAEVRHEWVDLSELARSVVAELERAEPQRRVQWDIEPRLMVQADPTLMRVVLQNLLGNAWKYTGQTADACISLRAEGLGEDGQLLFCIRDNGAGFDMAYADQLFQPFKRLHAHHEFEGTGIGLATVARVLQRHGGSIRGEGVVGQGATFCFSVPVEPQRPYADSAGGGR